MLHKCYTITLSSIVVFLLAAALIPGNRADAATPFPNYYISPDGFYLKVPAPYVPDGTIALDGQPGGGLKKPQDLFIDGEDHLFIADTENHRVVKTDNKGNILLVIGAGEGDSDKGKLSAPRGIFVDGDGMIYVTDSTKQRIVQYDKEGKFVRELGKPTSPLLGENLVYQPVKVIVDNRKYFYVVNQGDQKGLMMLDSEGQFRGYFGGNRVQATLATTIIRLLYNQQQRAGSYVNLPYSFNNVSLAPDGYIYSTTTGLSTKQVRKFNAVGGDIYPGSSDFTDYSFDYDNRTQNFVDSVIDDSGNMTIVDQTYGRMYQYDVSGRLLFAFGSNGSNVGNFNSAVAISMDRKGNLYVLDQNLNLIHRFRPTEFTSLVHKANVLYNEGKYNESFAPWQRVRDHNNFYELALQAMGQSELRQEEYSGAMDYFKAAYDKKGYSDAFYEYRREYVKEHFDVIASSVLAAVLVLYIALKLNSRRRRKGKALTEGRPAFRPLLAAAGFIKEAFWVMTHPFQGYEALKYENKGKWSKALLLMGLYIIVSILQIVLISFTFEEYPIQFVDWEYIILYPLLYWVLWSVVSYGLTTISSGEGRLREVFIATSYSFTPFIFFSIPLTLLTHLMTLKESKFYDLFGNVLLIWVIFLLYVSVRETHSFDTGKAFGISILTVLGSVIMILLVFVLYGLGMNLIDFAQQIAREAFYVGS